MRWRAAMAAMVMRRRANAVRVRRRRVMGAIWLGSLTGRGGEEECGARALTFSNPRNKFRGLWCALMAKAKAVGF
jgi:hypothetical protein